MTIQNKWQPNVNIAEFEYINLADYWNIDQTVRTKIKILPILLPVATSNDTTLLVAYNNPVLFQFIFPDRLELIHQSSAGKTPYSGVFHFDTLSNVATKLLFPEFDIRVYDIKLADKYHFFGTSGKGLIRYNEITQEIIQLTTKDGLASNLITEVYPENDSVVWLATNQGLNKVCFCNKFN